MKCHQHRAVTGGPLPGRREAVAQIGLTAAALALAPLVACSASSATGGAVDVDDDTALAQLMASSRPVIARRQQPYRITRSLRIPAGTTVRIEAGTHILWAGALTNEAKLVPVFEAMGDDTAILVIGNGEAVIESERPSPHVYAAAMLGRRGFAVTGIHALDCQHVYIGSTTWEYGQVRMDGPDANIARDVRITGGGARFRQPATEGNGACLLSYVDGAHVADARYENVPHGVQWWGGDAGLLPWQNGERANERKCRNILIERVSVRTAKTGGIWGSMGHDVIVRDCSVDECLDVGFDAEGSNDVTFERCTAHNGHNGCFTTFFLCDTVRFVDCRGSVDNKAYPLFRTYNVTQSHVDNRNVSVVGGRFECQDITGPGTMDTAMGPVRDLSITGATLVNVRIDTAFSNMHRTRIADNDLSFPRSLGTAAAIRAGSSKGNAAQPAGATVADNRIRYTAASPGQATAVEMFDDDFNSSPASAVTGNVVSGPFAIGVSLINATGNVGMRPSYVVSGNRFTGLPPSAQLLAVRQKGDAQRPAVQWDAAQTSDGRPVSLAQALGR